VERSNVLHLTTAIKTSFIPSAIVIKAFIGEVVDAKGYVQHYNGSLMGVVTERVKILCVYFRFVSAGIEDISYLKGEYEFIIHEGLADGSIHLKFGSFGLLGFYFATVILGGKL
jgi:hypothetical protein